MYTNNDDSNVQVNFNYTTSTVNFASGITSFTMNGGWGTGSRIQIYRLDAEKVADITVASNTTQVDISSLSIDKDSEYLLVSDIVGGVSGDSRYSVFPNDLTTETNYYSQYIAGIVSTAGAARSNIARIGNINLNERGINYSHIKLSNIGAFTNQSYQLRIGTDNIPSLLANFFVSSTYENLTSITKLNIKTDATNAIAAGSRLILYKLY